jgi:tetratricopeptide (TPR) repeat protein
VPIFRRYPRLRSHEEAGVARFIVSLICILLLWASAASEEDQFAQQLKLAGRYEKEGQLEAALEIYQSLLAERPEDSELLNSIQRIYKELKRYPKLIELVRQRLDRAPKSFGLQMTLGEALFLSGRVQEARETWLKALEHAPKTEETFSRVARAFWERGMLVEAKDVLLRGRRFLQDENLFAEGLARIYELGADYRAAIREHLIWLSQDARRMSQVNARLERLMERDGVEEVILETLESAVAGQPGRLEFRHLLGHHLIRMGRPDLAYGHFLILDDRDEDSSGKILMTFAQRCVEQGFHTDAIKACQEVAARYPDTPLARRAHLEVGHNLVALDSYEEALGAYEELIRQHTASHESAEALYARGEIYFLKLNEVDSALAAYRILAAGAGGKSRYADAVFRIGDCLTVQGDLTGARYEYQKLSGGDGPEEVREKAAYKLMELSLMEGKFQEAKEGFDQLVRTFPQGFYVNDALIQSMFLEESLSESQEALMAYVEATRLGLQRHYQRSLSEFQRTLDQFPSSKLGDDILIQMALLREKIGQHHEALADLQKLLAEHPQSRLCPEAQRRIGEIYEIRLKDLPMAIEAYEQVISNYPRYLFYDEVRKKVRRLRGEGTS